MDLFPVIEYVSARTHEREVMTMTKPDDPKGRAKDRKKVKEAREKYCNGMSPKDLCMYLADELIPSLEKLYEDHRKLHKAVVQLEFMAHLEVDKEATDGPVFASASGDPPDEDSPPSGPPPFPPTFE